MQGSPTDGLEGRALDAAPGIVQRSARDGADRRGEIAPPCGNSVRTGRAAPIAGRADRLGAGPTGTGAHIAGWMPSFAKPLSSKFFRNMSRSFAAAAS